MTDRLTFEEFRSKLADAVTTAINSGKLITAPITPGAPCLLGTFCPIGCWPNVSSRRPWPDSDAALAVGVSADSLSEFMFGFDRGRGSSVYAQLGRLYRERFSRPT